MKKIIFRKIFKLKYLSKSILVKRGKSKWQRKKQQKRKKDNNPIIFLFFLFFNKV